LALVLAYAGIGIATTARRNAAFFGADRATHPVLNGMALAAGAFLLAAAAGLANTDSADHANRLVIVIAACGGLAFSAFLIAPTLARFGGITVPDYLGERFGTAVRLLAVAALFLMSFPALVTVVAILGHIFAGVFTLEAERAVALTAATLLACTLFGGLRSAGATQAAQYAVLLPLCLLALGLVLAGGDAVLGVRLIPPDGILGAALGLDDFAAKDAVNRVALGLTVGAGLAAFPHLLMRAFAVPTAAEARWSFLWAIPLLAMLLAVAPPPVFAASGAGAAPLLEIALVGAAITACIALGSGLLLAMGNALSYDIFYRSVATTASPGTLLLVGRASLLLVAGLAGLAALRGPADLVALAPLAFSLAASCLLPLLVLGIWSRRMNGYGAIAGIVTGLVICLGYYLAPRYFPDAFIALSNALLADPGEAGRYETLTRAYELAGGLAREPARLALEHAREAGLHWWSVKGVFAAIFAMPAAFVVTILVSVSTRKPSADVQAFVADLRRRD
jgi:cation/acetate symporter